MPSRREVIVGSAAAAGLAMSARMGRLIEAAHKVEPTACAPLSDIEHVVLVMMENRSFDHYFGSFPGVRGFSDPHALRQPNGESIFAQAGYQPGVGPDAKGHLWPYHLNTRDLALHAECTDDITHDWGPQHEAWNHGLMNKWMPAHLAADGNAIGPLTMGYYTRADLTYYYSLAQAFTICDAYHCSVLGPTDPNRCYWFSATLDPEGTHGGPCLKTLTETRFEQYGKFSWTTMPEVLQEAGVSWRVYQDLSSDTLLNPLLYFKNYLTKPDLIPNAAAAYTYPGTFQADVAAGTLPQVSWVFPSLVACEHPSTPPALGELFVMTLLETLLANRAVWEKTAVFLMYDENGGFFDHVPPPVPPAGTAGEYLTGTLPSSAGGVAGPVGLGFRTPALVISPFSAGGYKYSGTLDHTSTLRLIESRFGVTVPNLTAWRRSVTGDFTGALNFTSAPVTAVPALPSTSIGSNLTVVEEAVLNALAGTEDVGIDYPLPTSNSMPAQEITPARPAVP
jgi:phospholipase C